MKAPRRFIAGATCPVCGNVDTVYLLKTGEGESRHCTRCELAERRPVEAPASDPVSEWQPVRFPDAPKGK